MTIGESEVRRRVDVADMMLTMHSRLRDVYRSRSLWLDLLIFGSSVVLCATVFLDPALSAKTPLGVEGTRAALGETSVFVFLLSVVSLLVDWKGASGRHARATESLADLKAKGRAVLDAPSDPARYSDYLRLYDFTMASIAPIPDAKFLGLKAYHLRKIALSREISRHPSIPVFLLRLRVFWADLTKAGKSNEGG